MIGRFYFAGGVDNLPIKLIEFNADTPFSIFETAVVQHYLSIANGYKDDQQFNYIFDTLKDSFAELHGIGELPMVFTSCFFTFSSIFFISSLSLNGLYIFEYTKS